MDPGRALTTVNLLFADLRAELPNITLDETVKASTLVLSNLLAATMPSVYARRVSSLTTDSSSQSSAVTTYDPSTAARTATTAAQCWHDLKTRDGSRFVPHESMRLESHAVSQLRTQSGSAGAWRFFLALASVQTEVQKTQRGHDELHLGGGVTLTAHTPLPYEVSGGFGSTLHRPRILLTGMMAAFCFPIHAHLSLIHL